MTSGLTLVKRLRSAARHAKWSTKRTRREPLDGLYPYYAGFAADFATRVITAAQLQPDARLLDPWNGAGTTTLVARDLGHSATGVDLNPVAALVASAKLANREDATQLFGLATDISVRAETCPVSPPALLTEWLPTPIATHFCTIQSLICELLASPPEEADVIGSRTLPPLAAFLMTCLLRSARTLARVRVSTNPGWIRPGSSYDVEPRDLSREWLSSITRFSAQLGTARGVALSPNLLVGDSRSLPADDNSFDFAVTSPPYCTRLDYVANTTFELVALGTYDSIAHLTKLRKASMGTPLTRERAIKPIRSRWPSSVRKLLQRIHDHPSSDSAGYYYKNYWQYFDDAYESLAELARVLKPGGAAVLVLQTSYYKDVPVDLSELYRAMGRSLGFRTSQLASLPVDRVMTQINSRSRKYLCDRKYVETVIALHTN